MKINYYNRQNKGITLIALVITIIILVILAAVSIRAITEMGIVGHAINGTQQYARGAVAENEVMGQTGNTIESTLARLQEIQNGNQGSNTNNQESDTETLLNALKNGDIHIGDYVNYQPPVVNETIPDSISGAMTENTGAQTFSISQQQSAAMGWRILGYGNSNGELTLNPNEATNVLLISAKPIQQQLALGRELEYLNGPDILNNLSKKFGISGNMPAPNKINETTARSVNFEDINTALEVDFTKESGWGDIDSNGRRIGQRLVDVGNTETLTYTWMFKEPTANDSSTVYYIGDGEELTVTSTRQEYSAYLNDSNDVLGYMLLDGAIEKKRDLYYWLASRSLEYDEGVVHCGCRRG